MSSIDPPAPLRGGWMLLAPLALAACGLLWPSARHLETPPPAEEPPWLAPALAEPGQCPPLKPQH
jgi:hypothetical protein